jgi:thiol-disulfide isomerase/thioredoxin
LQQFEMTENERAAPAERRGRTPLYILAAALAAIAGFGAMWIADRMRPSINTTTPGQQSSEGGAKPSGLERLVRVDSATPLTGITFTDGEGRQRTLNEWKGKVVLINLWATWCAPCKLEMPSLDRLQAKLGGADFAVLPISLDRTGADKPRAFLTSNKLENLELFLDTGNALTTVLRVPGLPLSVLVNYEGKEIARLAGSAEWDSPEAEDLIRAAIAQKDGS